MAMRERCIGSKIDGDEQKIEKISRCTRNDNGAESAQRLSVISNAVRDLEFMQWQR
jgi:hypothetical protein